MSTQNSHVSAQREINRRLAAKRLLESIPELPACLCAAMGILNNYDREKLRAFGKSERFSQPGMGTNPSFSAAGLVHGGGS